MVWWRSTPEGKSFEAKQAAQHSKLVAEMEKKRAKERSEREANKEFYSLENILETLRQEPDNINYCNSIPSLLQEGKKYHRYNYGQIYNLVLEILASNPDKIHIKTLCLELGRKHYANLRPDKKPTIYDEQAIQNDIQVRSK
jgi:hypothetical protein